VWPFIDRSARLRPAICLFQLTLQIHLYQQFFAKAWVQKNALTK